MEGVGARLGRSSARYGPTTVFSGPVRNWEKKWVHVPSPNSNHNHTTAAKGRDGSSRVLLYKWTPISPTLTDNSGRGKNSGANNDSADYRNFNKDDGVAAEEPLKKKFKYIPITALEEQKEEFSERMEDEAKPMETEPNTVGATSKSDKDGEKPNINYVITNESQATQNNPVRRRDLKGSTLDLSSSFKGRDGKKESDSKVESN